METMIGSKTIKPDGAEPDDFEQTLLKLCWSLKLTLTLNCYHHLRAHSSAENFPKNTNNFEKTFFCKHVGKGKILPKPTRKARNPLIQKRPRSRTLTAVYDAILEDLVFSAEIVGKRICVKLDSSQLIKVHLDTSQQTTIEHKVSFLDWKSKNSNVLALFANCFMKFISLRLLITNCDFRGISILNSSILISGSRISDLSLHERFLNKCRSSSSSFRPKRCNRLRSAFLKRSCIKTSSDNEAL
uniref:40S ribosomal protein S7 n=1 Tax=Glossina palpalis gambiensis TaxID=67801 RepID=A0A1B0B1K9_9MUSC